MFLWALIFSFFFCDLIWEPFFTHSLFLLVRYITIYQFKIGFYSLFIFKIMPVYIDLDEHIVMPNYAHAIIIIQKSGRRRSHLRHPPTPPCVRFRTRRFLSLFSEIPPFYHATIFLDQLLNYWWILRFRVSFFHWGFSVSINFVVTSGYLFVHGF